MHDIEFLVGFLGLLFGLALANVTTALADSWRARNDLPIGVMPFFIGTYIVLSIVDQWLGLAGSRDEIPINLLSMVTILGISLPYIFVSRALFPQHAEQWKSLEAFYLENRHEFLGALMIPPIVAIFSNVIGNMFENLNEMLLVILLFKGPMIVIPLAAMFIKSVRIHRVLFVILLIHMFMLILQRNAEL